MSSSRFTQFVVWLLCATAILSGCHSSKQSAKQQSGKFHRNAIIVADEHQLATDCLMIDAKSALLIGKKDGAKRIYLKIISENPSYSAAYYELGRLLLTDGQTDSALLMTQNAVRLADTNLWYRLQLADIYEKQQDGENLTKCWETIVKQHPDVLDYYYELSNAYITAGNITQAIQVLNRIENRYGVSEPVSLQKIKLWDALEKEDQAIAELERLANAMPYSTKYNAMIAEFYMKQKNYAKAKTYYDNIANSNPDDEYIHISLANYHRLTGDWIAGYRELQKGFALPGLTCDEKLDIMVSYFSTQDFYHTHTNEGLELLDLLSSQCPDNGNIALCHGDLLMRTGHYSEASKRFMVSLRADSSRYEVWESLLICLNANQPKSDTLADYARRAAILFPLHQLPSYIQAVCALVRNDYETAIKHATQCERIGFHRNYLEPQCCALLGDCYYHTQQYDKAWQYFERCLQLDSTDVGTLNNYAYFLAEQGHDLDKAERMSRKTIEADPLNATFLDTYAWILHKLGRKQDATSYIEKALKYAEEDRDTLKAHYDIITQQQ
ncbi:MAG: tetratricopeptide repeat protein [Bacteroidales bacterium]|nr:tetratricopeptide repeat protein [Candidatus Colimorpha onthohippi]